MKELGISQEVAKDDYIPESLFYLLGMKANNEKNIVNQEAWCKMLMMKKSKDAI